MKPLYFILYSFMAMGILTMLLSINGLIIFSKTGCYLIHPTVYILTFIMGLGWTVTAIASFSDIKKIIK